MKAIAHTDSELHTNLDIVMLAETNHLKQFELQGFYGFYSQATRLSEYGTPSGGIAIVVNSRLRCHTRLHYLSPEILVIQLTQLQLFIITAYFRPHTDIEVINDKIGRCVDNLPTNSCYMLFGDFNCRIDGQYDRGEILTDLPLAYNLCLINNPQVPTYYCHNGRSTIDLVYANEFIPRISHFEIKEHPMTKHCQVYTTVPIEATKNSQRHQRIKKCDPIILEAQLQNLINYQADENDVSNTSAVVTTALQNSAIQPKKRKSKPWFNSVLYHKLRLFRIMRQRNDPMVASAKLDYKRACRRRIFEYNAEKEQLVIRQAESDPRNLWKIMKSKPCTQSRYPTGKITLDRSYRNQTLSSNDLNLNLLATTMSYSQKLKY